MNQPQSHTKTFYGLATVGSKGQVVIPAKAREDLGIKTGDALVVIGLKEHTMLGMCPASSVEAMLAQMTQQLETIRTAIDKSKEKKEA